MSREENNINFQEEANQLLSQAQKDLIYKILHKELTREVLNIKDDISKKFFDYDNKMINYVSEMGNKMENLNEKWNRLFEEINIVKVKNEKSEQLETKINDFQLLIAQHDVRINNLMKDLNDACFKYDKMFLNNLQVPGQIGDCCKWKNLKEYLMYTMKEFSLLDAYKQKNQMSFQSYKDKLNLITGKLNNQVDNFLKTSFEYTTNKIEDIKKELNFQLDLINAQIPKLSLENSNFAKVLNKEITDLIKERENLKQLQIDFKIQLNNHFEQISLKEKETIQKIGEYKLEFTKIKKNFTQLSEFIKDVRFRRNINDDEMMNNQINKLVTNLKKNDEENGGEKKNKKKFKNVESIIKQIISGKKMVKKESNTKSINNEKRKSNLEIANKKKDEEKEEEKENENEEKDKEREKEKEKEREEEIKEEREEEKEEEEEKIADNNTILINNEKNKNEIKIIHNLQNSDLILKNSIFTNIEGNKIKNNIFFNNNMYTNNYFNHNKNNYNNHNKTNYNNQNKINSERNTNNDDNENNDRINNTNLYNSKNNYLENNNNLPYINLDYNKSKRNSNINKILNINSYNNIEKNNNENNKNEEDVKSEITNAQTENNDINNNHLKDNNSHYSKKLYRGMVYKVEKNEDLKDEKKKENNNIKSSKKFSEDEYESDDDDDADDYNNN